MTQQLPQEFLTDLIELHTGKVWCFVSVITKERFGLGIAIANEPGYYPIHINRYNATTFEIAADESDRLSTLREISETESASIIGSTMRGEIK